MSTATRMSTPRGQMTRGANSGPAIMLLPPAIRAAFMPNPPLKQIAPHKNRRKHKLTGVAFYLSKMEQSAPPKRTLQPTPAQIRAQAAAHKRDLHAAQLAPLIEQYRAQQTAAGGEYQGMNCYNTLFVGRLAHEVAERKLLREMEAFGPVKDLRIVKDNMSEEPKSRGYAFVEYEQEEDMKRAYRAADAMRIEGREIVVDVERGHTVPTWLPRRLGGGLGGTRLGGRDVNVNHPGRYDPSRPNTSAPQQPPMGHHHPSMGGMGRGGGPPPSSFDERGGGYGGSRPFDERGGYGGPPPQFDNRGPPGYGGPPGPPPAYGRGGGYGGYGGPPPPGDWGRGGYGGDNKRHRSRSPDRRDSHRRRF